MNCTKEFARTVEDIRRILTNPREYVDETQDLALSRIGDTLIMLGIDEDDGRLYFVLEDDETSDDYYVDEFTETPVARINFLGSNGAVGESIDYFDAGVFQSVVKEENHYGVPMTVILYRRPDGSVIPHDFIFRCDPPLQGMETQNAPLGRQMSLEKIYQQMVVKAITKE